MSCRFGKSKVVDNRSNNRKDQTPPARAKADPFFLFIHFPVNNFLSHVLIEYDCLINVPYSGVELLWTRHSPIDSSLRSEFRE